MEYLLDTANLEAIETYQEFFPVTGVTSNPSIVKKEGKIDFFRHMNAIRSIIGMEKTLHIQVTASDTEGMIKDAESIVRHVDEQVYIKVPVTMEGLKAIRLLEERKFHVTATAIYTKAQGFLAMEAGADFIAPYYNRIEHNGADSREVIAAFAKMIERYGYHTRILAASFKNMGQVDMAFLAGAHTATMDPALLAEALRMPSILKAVHDFEADWKSVFGDEKLSDMQNSPE